MSVFLVKDLFSILNSNYRFLILDVRYYQIESNVPLLKERAPKIIFQNNDFVGDNCFHGWMIFLGNDLRNWKVMFKISSLCLCTRSILLMAAHGLCSKVHAHWILIFMKSMFFIYWRNVICMSMLFTVRNFKWMRKLFGTRIFLTGKLHGHLSACQTLLLLELCLFFKA